MNTDKQISTIEYTWNKNTLSHYMKVDPIFIPTDFKMEIPFNVPIKTKFC